MSKIHRYYRKTEAPHSLLPLVREELRLRGLEDDSANISCVETESCFNVQIDAAAALSDEQKHRLEWLLAETFVDPSEALRIGLSHFPAASDDADGWTVEFGPRLTFTSAFSSNACSICSQCGIPISRLELSRRYRFVFGASRSFSLDAVKVVKSILHDRMTEEEYVTPLATFESGIEPEPVKTVPVTSEGRAALEKLNDEMGLGFDSFDLDYYTQLFKVRKSYFRDCKLVFTHVSTGMLLSPRGT
jgi:phosphoribosylformylglycinamidine synthase